MHGLPGLDELEKLLELHQQRIEDNPNIEYCLTLKRADGVKDRLFCATHEEAIEHAVDHTRLGIWKPTGISRNERIEGKSHWLHVMNGHYDLGRLVEQRLVAEDNAEAMEELPGYGSF